MPAGESVGIRLPASYTMWPSYNQRPDTADENTIRENGWYKISHNICCSMLLLSINVRQNQMKLWLNRLSGNTSTWAWIYRNVISWTKHSSSLWRSPQQEHRSSAFSFRFLSEQTHSRLEKADRLLNSPSFADFVISCPQSTTLTSA